VRIVLTGGPGGGKSTAGDLLRREFGGRVAFVPEAATLLFSGGFPRYPDQKCVVFQQKAIYQVQLNLEDVQATRYCSRVLLCDRGTCDGAAYCSSVEAWGKEVGTTLEHELKRYDAVIFFQSAAIGEKDFFFFFSSSYVLGR
jgi:predicted ATPase